MDKIKYEIDKENFLKLLSDYYSKLNNKHINVLSKVETKEDCCGYTIQECLFYYEENIKVLNSSVKQTFYLSESDINEVLKELLNKDDFDISNVYYKHSKREHESYLYIWSEEELTSVEITFSKVKEKQLKLTR